MKYLLSGILFLLFNGLPAQQKNINIVLISIDDLNDWVGCMARNSQAKTPGIDYLASQGMLFTNAHCQSPICNPSRSSLMTSLYPESTGIYFQNPDISGSEKAKDCITMPQRFKNEGFQVSGAGKLFHAQQNVKYWPDWRSFGPTSWPNPKPRLSPFQGDAWDWGQINNKDEDSPDYKSAIWAAESILKAKDTPFFIGVGFERPHVPLYASKKWYDLYPLETLELPKRIENDLEDISEYAVNVTRLKHIAPTFKWAVENNQLKPLIQSYLACVSYVDDQVAKVVKAVEESPHKDNTYIVLFSDHGFHLGEKELFAKCTLWNESTRVPMIIFGPGIKKGSVCRQPVQLMDIYPTLLELTGLKADQKLEGNSLAPLLKNPEEKWPHFARSALGTGNYAIISEKFRYIHYNDGSEEFYDLEKDPNEWTNQIKNSEYAEIIDLHRKQAPKQSHPILGKGSNPHNAYEAAESLKK